MVYLFENNKYRGQFESRNAAAIIGLRASHTYTKYFARPEEDQRNQYEFFLDLQRDLLSNFKIIDAEEYIISGKLIHPNKDPEVNQLFLSYEDATYFFSQFYRGKKEIRHRMSPHGTGWMLSGVDPLSSYEFNDLTRLVVMAHDACFRVVVEPDTTTSTKTLAISIFKRDRSGVLGLRKFPDMEGAIKDIRSEENYSLLINQK